MVVAVIGGIVWFAYSTGWVDKTRLNSPDKDTEHMMTVDVEVKLDNQVGTMAVKDSNVDVGVSEYSQGDGGSGI